MEAQQKGGIAMTRRTFIRLLAAGFVAGVLNELADDEEEGNL